MVRKELTKEQLGESYRIATVRLHEAITDLYESLFDTDGDPRIDPGNVANMISGLRVIMNQELDLIKESCYQNFEANLDDKSKQEEILFDNRKGS
jgi:hypothetical protein